MMGTITRLPPFQAFMEEHRQAVYRFLVAAVGPGEADDCFQETFLAALRAYPRLRNDDNLRGWVLTIAGRKVIDAARARRRRAHPAGEVPLEMKGHYENPDPIELDGRVWRAVAALPPRQRVAVVQRVVMDRPYAEVAATLRSSEEAARANVYQALKKLRKEMVDGEG